MTAMAGHARLETRALARSVGAVRGPLAVLALLAFVLSGSLIAGDRLVAAHTTSAFRAYLAAQSAAQTDLTATSTVSAASAATLAEATAQTNALVPSGLAGAVTPVHTAVIAQPGTWRKAAVIGHRSVTWAPQLSLASSPQATAAARYVQGSAPACPAGGCTAAGVLPIGVSQATADQLGLGVGTRLVLDPPTGGAGLTVQVSGIFAASGGTGAGAGSGHAFDDLGTLVQPRLDEWVPQLGPYAGQSNMQWEAEVLVPPAALSVVTTWQPAHATWRYHLEPDGLAGSAAATLSAEIKSRISSANLLGLGAAFSADTFSTHLAPTLDAFATLDASASALAEFALAGTAAIALAVLFLAIRILLGRQSTALALLRARGASGAVLASWIGVQALLVCVPATVLALLLCRTLISSAGHGALEWAVAGCGALGAPVLAASVVARAPRVASASRRRRGSRWIGRGTALLIGAVAVVGVRMRTGTGTGVDPLTALLPSVLAVDAAVLVSMLIPLLVRPAARLAGRGRGLVGYLAAAAAARRPTVDLVTAGALTAAATAAVFASCFTATLGTARVTESWQYVGADLRVSSVAGSGGALDPDALAAVAAAPGIAAHAEASVFAEQSLLVPQGGVSVTVYVVDPAEYRGLIRGTPLDTPAVESELDALSAAHGSAGTVPALVSADLLGLVQGLPSGSGPTIVLAENTLDLAPLGSAAAFPPATGTSSYLVVPRAGLSQALPAFQTGSTVAWYTYKPGVTAPPAAAARVPASAVATRAETMGGYGNDLLSALSAWISRAAGVLDVLLAAACVLLAAAATAKARAASSAFLLTMGTRRRSAAAVSVFETVPMLLAIGVAAVAAGYGAAQALLPALAAIGGVPRPTLATLPPGALLAALAVPALGVLVTTAGAGFGREAQLSFQRTGG
ncbi:hypothetical protein KDL01_16830 [Actinospica durhamensis]|uniref:FtsX-like permease family protein n=1 Tax=Actinospica durhamensis TaxID=1508375 RepID=A0A941IU07_9ACTN|nr:hypothetical protein [Actinospica durhamensis]MBR7834941.1 hypothetical protein [Actinospica durhamensis]